MKDEHYKEKLSSFVNRELPNDERQKIGEHLLYCQDCRKEHEQIKFGAALAQNLPHADAPNGVWNKIESELNERKAPRTVSFFNAKNLAYVCVPFAVILVFTLVFYLNLFDWQDGELAKNESENSREAPQTEKSSAWRIENLAGEPKVINSNEKRTLDIGETLETDGKSRAKIDVADIGQVEIAPNSIVKLVNSSEKEHRLALERGTLQARIFAPPRLFVVDTPSAAAIDLGCAYKLEVDEAGNSKLHVTSGYVALERDGRESIVPADAFCLTERGKGLGTPFFGDAAREFITELKKYDFENGAEKSLNTILQTARKKDTLSLWHLLSRVSENERGKVLEKILSFAKLPEGVTEKGILRLDKTMLERLKDEIEVSWYE